MILSPLATPLVRMYALGLGGFLVWMASFSSIAHAQERVRSLAATEMNWELGQRHVEAELRASGYQVTSQTSDAVNPGDLLEELRAAQAFSPKASVTVIGIGHGGFAYVWLPQTGRLYRADAPHVDPTEAATVLSLKVVELVRLQGQGHLAEREHGEEIAARERAPDGPPQKGQPSANDGAVDAGNRRERGVKVDGIDAGRAPAERAQRSQSGRLSLSGGGGILWGSGLSRPLPELDLGLDFQFAPHFLLGLTGASSLRPTELPQKQGSVRLTAHRLGLRVAWTGGHRIFWQLGPSVALQCLNMQIVETQPTLPDRTICLALLSARLRTGLRIQDVSLWVEAEVGAGSRSVRLLEDARAVATLGRPWLFFTGGLTWHF